MSYAQRRLLTAPCLACNREHGQPMCDLCSELEYAEENPYEPERIEPDEHDRD